MQIRKDGEWRREEIRELERLQEQGKDQARREIGELEQRDSEKGELEQRDKFRQSTGAEEIAKRRMAND